MSKLSIIIPVFNEVDGIMATIKSMDSLINENKSIAEIIFVDDGSTDGTSSIMAEELSGSKNISLVSHKKNKGYGAALKTGIRKSKSDYVAFIDSDDIWKKDKLETQLRFMENNNFSFTYTSYETFGKKIKFIKPPNEYNYKKFIHNTSICTSTMLIKREILKKVKFSETKICEDYFFKCELLKKTNAYCLDDYLTKYRVRKDSLQSNSLRNFYWIWKINREFNKLNFLENFSSLTLISLNSLIKYGFKNF